MLAGSRVLVRLGILWLHSRLWCGVYSTNSKLFHVWFHFSPFLVLGSFSLLTETLFSLFRFVASESCCVIPPPPPLLYESVFFFFCFSFSFSSSHYEIPIPFSLSFGSISRLHCLLPVPLSHSTTTLALPESYVSDLWVFFHLYQVHFFLLVPPSQVSCKANPDCHSPDHLLFFIPHHSYSCLPQSSSKV